MRTYTRNVAMHKICGLVDCMPGRNRHCYVAIGGEELLITTHSPVRLVRPTGWTMPAMIDADLGYLCVRRRVMCIVNCPGSVALGNVDVALGSYPAGFLPRRG